MKALQKTENWYLIGCIIACMLLVFSTCNRAYCQEGMTASEIELIKSLTYQSGGNISGGGEIKASDWWNDTILIIDAETGWLLPDTRVASKWVIDSVYNAGNDKCIHSWVEKDIRAGMYKDGTCLVMHDESGCPDTWGHVMRICRHCLRKEEVHEERTVEYIEVIDEFEELNKKIKK